MKGFTAFFFFGNYFYGFCAVALAIEASLQQGQPLNGLPFYGMLFVGTVLFYSYPYVRRVKGVAANPRTRWYQQHYILVRNTQIVYTLALAAGSAVFLYHYGNRAMHLSWMNSFLVVVFPFVAALYYGLSIFPAELNLRKVGWLKPYLIGFTWAGAVTIYPVLLHSIISGTEHVFDPPDLFLFIKNFLFISLLCIMFDVKDYAADHSGDIRTYVVKYGLRKTIFGILMPLCIGGLAALVVYGINRQFNPLRIVINVIPFLLLLLAARSLRRRRPLLYYYTTIDGLMLAKAVCGAAAALLL
ncbi:MAG: hypothetical protein QM664_08410 [Flavihumibacter sp.]